jgi:hypothetical protein
MLRSWPPLTRIARLIAALMAGGMMIGPALADEVHFWFNGKQVTTRDTCQLGLHEGQTITEAQLKQINACEVDWLARAFQKAEQMREEEGLDRHFGVWTVSLTNSPAPNYTLLVTRDADRQFPMIGCTAGGHYELWTGSDNLLAGTAVTITVKMDGRRWTIPGHVDKLQTTASA